MTDDLIARLEQAAKLAEQRWTVNGQHASVEIHAPLIREAIAALAAAEPAQLLEKCPTCHGTGKDPGPWFNSKNKQVEVECGACAWVRAAVTHRTCGRPKETR